MTEPTAVSYDGLERLTALSGTLSGGLTSSETFSYDPGTNISARTGPAATCTMDGADRLTQRGSDTFAYDALARHGQSDTKRTLRTKG